MKVLIAHNRYRSASPSGENKVVDAEMRLLEEHGVSVLPFIAESDSLTGASAAQKLAAGLGPIYAAASVGRINELLAAERPDVVHVHNVFPLLSPWIVRSAKAAGVPVVQTVHNYRHTCVNGLHVRQGRRCDDCLNRTIPWPAVAHACYRDSNLQSVPMALSQVLHKSTWRLVDAFIALTPFMADRLVRGGLPRDRIRIRPTWVPDTGTPGAPGRDFAYVGRLDEAKGVRLLLDAWARRAVADRDLVIAGDGPLRDEVEAAAQRDPSVRYLGRLDDEAVARMMAACGAVVIPSIVYEGYPLTMAEAFACGRPVIVSAGGSAASAVSRDTGWVSPLSAGELAGVLAAVTAEELARRGRGAREQYERAHSPAAALTSLLQCYEGVIGGSASPDG